MTGNQSKCYQKTRCPVKDSNILFFFVKFSRTRKATARTIQNACRPKQTLRKSHADFSEIWLENHFVGIQSVQMIPSAIVIRSTSCALIMFYMKSILAEQHDHLRQTGVFW